MATLSFTVHGTPAPQGSKRAFIRGGRPVIVESSKAVRPWREAVKWAALEARNGRPPIDGPLALHVTFYLPAPKSLSRAKATLGACRKPDLDKLLRSTLDALTDAGIWTDDARVCMVTAQKGFVGCRPNALDAPGARVSVFVIAAPPESLGRPLEAAR